MGQVQGALAACLLQCWGVLCSRSTCCIPRFRHQPVSNILSAEAVLPPPAPLASGRQGEPAQPAPHWQRRAAGRFRGAAVRCGCVVGRWIGVKVKVKGNGWLRCMPPEQGEAQVILRHQVCLKEQGGGCMHWPAMQAASYFPNKSLTFHPAQARRRRAPRWLRPALILF